MALAHVSGPSGPGSGMNSPREVGSSPYVMAALNHMGPPGIQATIYSADGIKQELIQIPQLSSSTSSPDSSPSPGQTTITNSHGGGTHYTTTTSAGSLHVSPGHPAAMGAGAGPGGVQHLELIVTANNPNGNSPPGSGLSPKTPGSPFHYSESGPPGVSGALSLSLNSGSGSGKIPLLLRELQMTAPDDKEWQTQLFGLLQNQTYNQCEVDLFELMCKVIDQSLFAQVDWARNSIFFKDLKVSEYETHDHESIL